MNDERTQLDELNAEIAAQTRAMFEAARQLGLPIGHLPPWEAVHQIIVTGYGDMVSAKARAMFPEAFEKKH